MLRDFNRNYIDKRKKKKTLILSLTSFSLSPAKDAPSQYLNLTLFQLKKSVHGIEDYVQIHDN